ncbi:transporter substrate-binding domain-containing protein (plasmid) [Methylorubrum extorquens]|uniref:Transporter substrate-binding domain-containing protein n=1 Tax=Methylorubrum extorquens TaxID=408 RepID=A0AAX3WMW1_METEX|nr:transporter substrate-binding domain-containing protein [Methylorubrum extorquens]
MRRLQPAGSSREHVARQELGVEASIDGIGRGFGRIDRSAGRPSSLRGARVAAALVAIAVSCGAALARPLDAVVASGVLRVALYSDNRPFSGMGKNGPEGIEVDLARGIAAALGVAAEVRIVEAAETVDGDFRLNLWKGDLAGTPLADLMLHVPSDRQLGIRNEQIVLTAPYYEERLAVALRGTADLQALGDLEEQSIAVAGASPADTALLFADGGRHRAKLRHFRDFDGAARAFLSGEAAALAGAKSAIEAALHAASASPDPVPVSIVDLPSAGLVRARLALGGAVRGDSRDLGYALSDAVGAMARDGRLRAIFSRYGVTYVAPPGE